MRIIAGHARGRPLRSPAGRATRPTADRVREALFSILGPPPESAQVLDLFAGAGTLGLEALSRGAANAIFVDRDRNAVRCLHANIASVGVADRAHVVATDVLSFLARSPTDAHFTWVFLDPPYATDLGDRALTLLGEGDRLQGDSVVVLEHDRRRLCPETCGVLEKSQTRRYGDTALTLYRPTQT